MTTRSQPSIQRRLMVLVLACVVPTALMVATIIGYYYQRERAAISQNTLTTARALVLAVDQQFKAIELGLSVLATSELLQRGDLAGFYDQADAVVLQLPISNIMLAGPDRESLLNTLEPFGQKLPPAGGTQYRDIFEKAQPSVGNLFTSPLRGTPLVAVGVPVIKGGEVAYSLNAGIVPARIQALLMQQQLPAGWLAAIVDASGTIVARTVSPERYVGAKPPSPLRERLQQVREDAFESVSLDGVPVITVFSKSDTTGWAVVIGIPLETLNAGLKRSLRWLIGTSLVLLAGMLLLARYLSLTIIRSTRGLVAPAVALGRGEPVVVPEAAFREAAELGTAIEEAATRLGEARQAQEASEAELKRANDALVRSNIDLQQFAFVASHDLRTPLRSIHGYVQMLGKRYGAKLDDGARGLIQRTTGAVNQLDQLLQDLLGYARMDATARAFAPVDLNEVFDATLQLLDAQIVESGATVTHDPLPVVPGDRTQLVQLMQNLLSNGIKYHAEGAAPRVHVTAEHEPDAGGWLFAVTDDGIGIDARHHEAIFEVFKRLHASQEYPGTGIGLALAARIVKRHHGRIWVRSAEGDGSTFFFTLPRSGSDPS